MEKARDSIALPPFHLLAYIVLLMLVTYYSIHYNYKERMQETIIQFRMILFCSLPVILVLVMRQIITKYRVSSSSTTASSSPSESQSVPTFPWGVALMLALVLVMLYYHSYTLSL